MLGLRHGEQALMLVQGEVSSKLLVLRVQYQAKFFFREPLPTFKGGAMQGYLVGQVVRTQQQNPSELMSACTMRWW